MKQTIRLTESELKNIIRKALNEVKYGGQEFHGDNPKDWLSMSKERERRGTEFGGKKRSEYETWEEIPDDARKEFQKGDRNEENGWEAKAIRTSRKQQLDKDGEVYAKKLISLNPRLYRKDDMLLSQVGKVFNDGQGVLAFAKFLTNDNIILVNKTLAGKNDIDVIKNNFPEWNIEFVELGYPDWYKIRNLESCRKNTDTLDESINYAIHKILKESFDPYSEINLMLSSLGDVKISPFYSNEGTVTVSAPDYINTEDIVDMMRRFGYDYYDSGLNGNRKMISFRDTDIHIGK